jgi:hypothetical protein
MAERVSQVVAETSLEAAYGAIQNRPAVIGAQDFYDENGAELPGAVEPDGTLLIGATLGAEQLTLTFYFAASVQNGGGFGYKRTAGYACVQIATAESGRVSIANAECDPRVLAHLGSATTLRSLSDLGL